MVSARKNSSTMVTLGIDQLLADPPESVLKGNVGLITNPSGVNEELIATIDLLADHSNINLEVVFGPEHGVRGDRQAGVEYGDGIDDATGVPMKSLYGETRRLKPDAVADLDVVIFDIQTVGCRFYTYLYTLAYALEGIASTDTELIVCDRPNPIAPMNIDGNRIPDTHANFVGGYRLPIIYGLTVGEIASYFNYEFDINANLTVIELSGWDHDDWYDETDLYWVQPSPNIPTLTAAILYPGTCLFEGTTLSEGRGTTTPFETIGAPWIDPIEFSDTLNNLDLPGVIFRPMYFTPSFSKHKDKRCAGVQIHFEDRDQVEPIQVGLTVLITAFQLYPKSDWSTVEDNHTIDRLAGGPIIRERINAMGDENPLTVCKDIRTRWIEDIEEFGNFAAQYRLY